MADTNDILHPRALILPVVSPASTWATAEKGTIVISGALLYFNDGSAWRLVTSA